MKKLLLLLVALLTGVSGAWATTSITVNTGSPLTSVSQISTDKYYVLYNQGRSQYMNINPATGQVLLTASLPTSSDAALLPFIVRFVPNTNAKSEGDAYQLKFYDGSYLPYRYVDGGRSTYVSPTMGYNPDNNAGYLPAYNESYFTFRVYVGNTAKGDYFNGNNGAFTFWDDASSTNAKYQIYEAECEDFQEINYYYQIGTSNSENAPRKLLTVKSQTIALPTATAASTIPAFTSYDAAPIALSDGSAIAIPLIEAYPFETTALVAGEIPASAPLYRLKGNVGNTPKYIKRSEASVIYKADDGVTTDDYFCFTGDNIAGFRIYNLGAGTSVNLGSDSPSQGTSPALTSKDHIWRLYKNSDSFGFQQLKTDETSLTNAYLCNVGSVFTYWLSSAAESTNDGGARMQCERVTFDVTDETWVRVGEADYELLGSVSQTYNSGDAYVQNVLTETPSGVALTNDNVTGAPSNVSSNTSVRYYYTSASEISPLPFTTTSISNGNFVSPTWYYMTINDYPAYANDSKMKVDNTKGPLYYDRWCFVGDAAHGVQIFSEATGVTKPLRVTSFANNARVELTTTTTNSVWTVAGTSLSDITFSQSNGTTYYLNQLGASGGGSYNWEIGMYDGGGSTVVLTPASDANTVAKITAAIPLITGNTAYTNQGQLAYPTTAEYNTLNTALLAASSSQTADNYKAMRDAWQYYQFQSPVVYPTGGKFYRIKGVDSGRYLTCEAAPSKSDRLGASETKTPNTIFLLEGAYNSCKLLGYTNGFYTYNTCQEGSLALADQTYVLNVPGTLGEFSIKGGGYLYSWTNSNMYFDRNGDTYASQCHMIIEPVEELPVTFKGKYASLYSPVDLTLPSGVKAYTGTLNGEKTKLELSEVDKVPANTGVILEYADFISETTIDFPILSTVTPVGGTALLGTTAAQSVDAGSKLVLGKDGEGNWGIYTYGTGEGKVTLGGFKAYMDDPGSSVKGFTFSFGDLNEVVSILNGEKGDGEVYDLSGRQTKKPTRGFYITKGQKAYIK